MSPLSQSPLAEPALSATLRAGDLGCVSFLNSKPLIDPLLHTPGIHIEFAVPSALQALIEQGRVATALMSVVDFQTTRADLVLVPASMIGCDGTTLTVRIFSRVPVTQIHTLYADTDSHTSVVLAQIILRERYSVAPAVLPFSAREGVHLGSGGGERAAAANASEFPEAMLLIGDKVVNASPDERIYSHQLDLGEQWKLLTGLPFVFAMWMMRKDVLERDRPAALHVAALLADARRRGADLTEHLLDRYAQEKQWPRELARRYFTEYLRYEVTPRAREGLARFLHTAAALKLIPERRPLEFLEIPIP